MFLELQRPRRGASAGRLGRAGTTRRRVGIDAQLAILIDPLSTLMCLVVAGVSTLIHLYSVAYMGGDRGYTRFFAYLNFFVFSMLLLVLAANFFLLIVGWAFVGAASYFLISFWYRRKTATAAGIKAFVINVVGDVGLVLGTYFIFQGTGTLDFLQTFARIDQAFTVNQPQLVAGCILLLVGAFAKSAQVPLHTWLPDAMEGPTPVSALIHAATDGHRRRLPDRPPAPAVRARAGRRRGGRDHRLRHAADRGHDRPRGDRSQARHRVLDDVPDRLHDHGRLARAAYAAGMFHLMTHAFFKALLFMAAGSVISAMGGNQNLDRMGGFRKVMPFTYGCMIIGGLALSGIPPFSGFWSKDEIISLEFERGGWHTILGVLGYLGAFLTAIYTFRMIFRAFHGRCARRPRSSRTGTSTTRPSRPTRPPARSRTPTSASPAPSTTSPSGRAPMKIAMGALAAAGDRRRLPADPGRHVRAAPLPGADVRGLRALRGARADRDERVDRPARSAPSSGSPASAIAWRIYGHGGNAAALQARFRRAAQVLRQQVVLRRGDRLPDRAAVRLVRALLPTAPSSGVLVNGALVGGGDRARARRCRPRCAASSRATCATTPRCCSSG